VIFVLAKEWSNVSEADCHMVSALYQQRNRCEASQYRCTQLQSDIHTQVVSGLSALVRMRR